MAEKYEGIIAQIENKGINKGKKEIINSLLKKFSMNMISEMLKIDKSEIEKILSE